MASFICPRCEEPTLAISHALSLGADCRSDEIRIQAIACAACAFRGVAAYEESRRGSLDSESWDHRGSGLTQGEHDALVQLIEACPDPGNERCGCDSHNTLGQRDGRDRWMRLSGLKLQAPFAFFMQRGN